jgi:hypothetical protein
MFLTVLLVISCKGVRGAIDGNGLELIDAGEVRNFFIDPHLDGVSIKSFLPFLISKHTLTAFFPLTDNRNDDTYHTD